jgi:hypothetical protein
MPRTKISDQAIYLADNGAAYCGAHLGVTARMTGRDLSGQAIQRVNAGDSGGGGRDGMGSPLRAMREGGPQMRIENLPEAGTDRFAVPGLDGKRGRLLHVGPRGAIVEWESAVKTKQFLATRVDRKTGEEYKKTVTVPVRGDRGPVSLAVEVEPLLPPSPRYHRNGGRS